MTDGEINYVRSHDGLHLAYRVAGTGPLTILEVGGFGALFPLDASDEQPRWRRFEDRLETFARLIKFDLRGVGYSEVFSAPPTVDDYVSDALAVLDACGVDRACVFSSSFGGPVALALAARHPERVESLVLANTGARMTVDEGYSLNPELEALANERRAAVAPDAETSSEDNDIDYLAPSLAAEADVRAWWQQTARRGAGPAVAEAMWKFTMTVDQRDALEQIEAPTLVLVSARNGFVGPELTRWMAERLDRAELVEIDAADHVIWAIPGDAIVNEIERFLTGSITSAGDRAVAAVLFTDIVDSTSENAARGDQAWLELLARHDRLAETEVALRGGRVVKRLGDGLLSTFPLASQALDAGAAIVEALERLGIGVRIGIHVAEVQEVGDDVLRLGVTIAARVMSEAPRGVLTTGTVVELLAGSDKSFEHRGTRDLKGVPGTWRLYEPLAQG